MRAAAYCFTGWRFDRDRSFTIDAQPAQHRRRRTSSGNGCQHRSAGHRPGHPQRRLDHVTCPPRFWSHLAYPVTPTTRWSPTWPRLRRRPQHGRAASRPSSSTRLHLRRGRVRAREAAGRVRGRGVAGARRGPDRLQRQTDGGLVQASWPAMGQVLFDPPSVGGWGQNEYWLSTAAALARWNSHTGWQGRRPLHGGRRGAGSRESRPRPTCCRFRAGRPPPPRRCDGRRGDPAMLVTLALVSPEYVSN